MPDTFGIYIEKPKLVTAILFLFVCVGFCLYMLAEPKRVLTGRYSDLLHNSHIAGVLGLVTLLPMVLAGLKSLLTPGPVISINRNGIYDRRMLKRIIPWSGIVNAGMTPEKSGIAGLTYLVVELSDYERANLKWTLTYRLSWGYKTTKKSNLVFLQVTGLDYDANDVLSAIQSLRNARPVMAQSFRAKPFGNSSFS